MLNQHIMYVDIELQLPITTIKLQLLIITKISIKIKLQLLITTKKSVEIELQFLIRTKNICRNY